MAKYKLCIELDLEQLPDATLPAQSTPPLAPAEAQPVSDPVASTDAPASSDPVPADAPADPSA